MSSISSQVMSHIRDGLWLGFLGLALAGLTSCQQPQAKNRYQGGGSDTLVDPKYSLAADREKLDELRKEIPQDIQQKNDEEAFVKQLLGDGTRPPQDVRRSFDEIVRKKRSDFDRDTRRERETYQNKTRKDRDAFLSKLSKERTDFTNKKHDRNATQEFYKNQDERRRKFFADERERSDDFESQFREKRRNFEDHIKSKQNDFNAEMKIYQQNYDEARKKEREQKKAGG